MLRSSASAAAFLSLVLLSTVHSRADAAPADFMYAEALGENRLTSGEDASTGVGGTSGGAVIPTTVGNQPATLVSSFGQPFAGAAYYTDALSTMDDQADLHYGQGSEFLSTVGADSPYSRIVRRGIVSEGAADNNENLLTDEGYFHPALLTQAEQEYRAALMLDPDNEDAMRGLLDIIQAYGLRNSVLADAFKRRQLRVRLTAAASDTANAVINRELAEIDKIADVMEESIALLLGTLFEPNGVGPLMRSLADEEALQAYEEDTVNKARETQAMAFSAARRYGEAKLDAARLLLLRDFLNTNTRETLLNGLAETHAYLVEVVRLVSPFVNADEFAQNRNDSMLVSQLMSQINAFRTDVEEGYNPFGFLPDFVPFSQSDQQDGTYLAMKSTTDNTVAAAVTKESEAVNFFTELTDTEINLAQKLDEIQTTYEQRLRSLVGSARKTEGGQTVDVPDLYTFMAPDVDLDEDGITERDALRAQIAADPSYGVSFAAPAPGDPRNLATKGELGQQYLTVEAAEDRINLAQTQLQNLLQELQIREETARAVYALDEEIYKITLSTGNEIGALARQRGVLQQNFYDNQAHKLRKNAFLNGLMAGASTAAPFFARGGSGSEAAALDLERAIRDRATYIQSPHQKIDPVTIGIALGAGAAFSAWKGSRDQAKALAAQGQLAREMADLDGRIEELRFAHQAKVQLLGGQQRRLQAESEVKIIALRQSELLINLHMAQRDHMRELSRIQTLITEAMTLTADLARSLQLAADVGQFGWLSDDVRLVQTDKVIKANKSFERAQVWCFITLRALDYHATLSPAQWQTFMRPLYQELYLARNSDHLKDLLLHMEQTLSQSDIFFDTDKVSCGGKAILSLKYHYVAPASVTHNTAGEPSTLSAADTEFAYRDPSSGTVYTGARAFQAAFREALRRGFTSESPRQLVLRFATDLFERDQVSEGGQFYQANNPFDIDVTNGRFIAHDCENTTGIGIQINMTGNFSGLSARPAARVFLKGNSYLKHSHYVDGSTLRDPWEAITVYSAYRQRIPAWLSSDLGASTTSGDVIDSGEELQVSALFNGSTVPASSIAALSKSFTNRPVANDHWEIVINDTGSANRAFLDKVQAMLALPVPQDPSTDVLTDIQVHISWGHRD